jgi:hypothetical protein
VDQVSEELFVIPVTQTSSAGFFIWWNFIWGNMWVLDKFLLLWWGSPSFGDIYTCNYTYGIAFMSMWAFCGEHVYGVNLYFKLYFSFSAWTLNTYLATCPQLLDIWFHWDINWWVLGWSQHCPDSYTVALR